jgi:glycine oxidase
VAQAAAARGARVRLVTASEGPDAACCSWWAGGMLAPDCEMETAEPLIGRLGAEGIAFWRSRTPPPVEAGTLVVAAGRDRPELARFARRTGGHRPVAGEEIAALEPDLAGRFGEGLFFEGEGHVDARAALRALWEELPGLGVAVERRRLPASELAAPPAGTARIDCRGLAARDALPGLRGVRGEMAVVRSREVSLTRTVRLLHPRWPLYIVPRGDGVHMVGATQIESERRGPVTVRAALELLSALHALNPAFGEAEMLETGADLRPAFPDNLPRLVRRGRVLHLNGLFRHGFLCAPALARRAVEHLMEGQWDPEVMEDEETETGRHAHHA